MQKNVENNNTCYEDQECVNFSIIIDSRLQMGKPNIFKVKRIINKQKLRKSTKKEVKSCRYVKML